VAERVEVPEHVKAFAEALRLEIVGKPEEVKPPGFEYPCWKIPVRDEGTGEVVWILNAYPVAELGRYKMVKLTNKLGHVVTVLTFKEEVPKVEVPMPTAEEVRAAREEAERIAPQIRYEAPADWRRLGALATRIKEWVAACERHLEARRAFPIYTYLQSIKSWLSEAKDAMLEAAPELTKAHEKREVPPIQVLRPEEKEELWERFARPLRVAKLDPEAYRGRFEAVIAPNMPYEENLFMIQDEAGAIIEEELLRKKRYVDKLVKEPTRFNWKWVGWGLASLKLSADQLAEAVKEKNAASTYMATSRMLETSEKLKALLKLHPEVPERF